MNEVTFERMAGMMLELQAKGVHAIGFVSPTHFVPQIVRALSIAIPQGLELPLIYNTNAYDSVEVLKLLDGIFDIYLPDLKYSDDEFGYKYSKVKSYTEISRAAVKEMHRQVGSDVVVWRRRIGETRTDHPAPCAPERYCNVGRDTSMDSERIG